MTHERIEQLLRALGCDIGAAECHGILCGMLSDLAHFNHMSWLQYVSGADDIAPYTAGEVDEALRRLVADTRAALEDGDYVFALLLPDDEQPLAERAGAFGSWCRGYLSGLGLTGIADLGALGEDAREFLADMQRFGLLAADAVGGEDDEHAFAELTEFARIGVQLVRAERHGQSAGDTTGIH